VTRCLENGWLKQPLHDFSMNKTLDDVGIGSVRLRVLLLRHWIQRFLLCRRKTRSHPGLCTQILGNVNRQKLNKLNVLTKPTKISLHRGRGAHAINHLSKGKQAAGSHVLRRLTGLNQHFPTLSHFLSTLPTPCLQLLQQCNQLRITTK